MVLYIEAKTAAKDAFIDFLELETLEGKTISVFWEASGIRREEYGFSACYNGVTFNDEDASGRLNEIVGAKLVAGALYSESCKGATAEIVSMTFGDGGGAEYKYEGPAYTIPASDD